MADMDPCAAGLYLVAAGRRMLIPRAADAPCRRDMVTGTIELLPRRPDGQER